MNKKDNDRNGGPHCEYLKTFCEYIFSEYLKRFEGKCRREAMSFLSTISPFIKYKKKDPHMGSTYAWLEYILKREGTSFPVLTFEGIYFN